MKKTLTLTATALLIVLALSGCTDYQNDNDQQVSRQQDAISKQGNAQVGMPAILNFREKRELKDILELRDQANLVTYTYTEAAMTGKLVYQGESIGYGIPASTQYTNPQKLERDYLDNNNDGSIDGVTAQADPNGLFSPPECEGTWVMMVDPKTKNTTPVYWEPEVVVSQFKLPNTQ